MNTLLGGLRYGLRKLGRNSSFAAVAALTLVLGATGCTVWNGPAVGETHTISKSVPLGREKSVAVDINMGVGNLRVEGGAKGLMNAAFTYNVDAWRPEVRYDANGDQGRLTIQQPPDSHHFHSYHNFHGVRYEWHVRLNNRVPMEMNVNTGVGQASLKLAGLNLSQLKVRMGVGGADIDLTGRWGHNLEASVQGGVGKATLRLPHDVGVRVTVQGGLGTIRASGFSQNGDVYTNSAYGKSPVNLNISVEGGVGEVDLALGGRQPKSIP